MAYGRKRRGYSRRGRRGRRLSSYNIATKTSAKSQSKQIYALNRRISYIQRMTKPQMKVQQAGLTEPQEFSGDAYVNLFGTPIYPRLETGSTFVPSTTDTPKAQNRFSRLQRFSLYANIHYFTAPTSGILPVTFRVIIVQTKVASADAIVPADIFTSMNNDTSYFAGTFGPLQNGLARQIKVLSDKRYTLSFQRPSITVQTHLKYLMPVYYDKNTSSSDESSNNTIPKGAIYVFVSSKVITSTLPSDVTTKMDAMWKLVFTSN